MKALYFKFVATSMWMCCNLGFAQENQLTESLANEIQLLEKLHETNTKIEKNYLVDYGNSRVVDIVYSVLKDALVRKDFEQVEKIKQLYVVTIKSARTRECAIDHFIRDLYSKQFDITVDATLGRVNWKEAQKLSQQIDIQVGDRCSSILQNSETTKIIDSINLVRKQINKQLSSQPSTDRIEYLLKLLQDRPLDYDPFPSQRNTRCTTYQVGGELQTNCTNGL